MGGLPDPDWYFDNVLIDAVPGGQTRIDRGPAARWQAWWRAIAAVADGPLVPAVGSGFVATTAELAAQGVTRSATRAAVRRGSWTVAARGAIAPLRVAGSGDTYLDARRLHALQAAALWRARPSHVVAGRSAAITHGLPVLRTPPAPQLLAPERSGLGRRGAGHAYGAAVQPADVERWFGVPVTTVARTLVDLARHDRLDAIMAADAAFRERLLTRREVDEALAGAAGWPGVRTARTVLALADPAAESALESVVRLLLHLDDFPPPQLQVEIAGYRVDFCWPAHRLVLEADGRGKYTGEALWREKQREHVLRSCGYRVERVLWADLFSRWPATAARIWAALAQH